MGCTWMAIAYLGRSLLGCSSTHLRDRETATPPPSSARRGTWHRATSDDAAPSPSPTGGLPRTLHLRLRAPKQFLRRPPPSRLLQPRRRASQPGAAVCSHAGAPPAPRRPLSSLSGDKPGENLELSPPPFSSIYRYMKTSTSLFDLTLGFDTRDLEKWG